MKSFVEEFQGDHERNSDLVICICGPSGAGKGTLGKFIANELNVSLYSAGDFFRELAEEKGLTVEELSKKADKETDIEVDKRTLSKGLNEDCVIESRIAAWILGDYADLSIFVTAGLEERARRVEEDLENREAEKEASSLEEIKERIKQRDENNRSRYEKYYGIDMNDTSIFDLVIDNSEMEIEEQNRLVRKALKKEFPDQVGQQL